MKIAQILPDIPNLGGLATRTFEQHKIFNSLKGIKADFFKMTRRQKNLFEKTDIEINETKYGLSVSQYEVSYNSKVIKESLKKLNEYDILWFNHACPHIGIETSKEKDPELWMKFYTDTKGKKVALATDVYLDKYYPWFLNVVPNVTLILGTGHAHAASWNPYLSDKVDGILDQPFLLKGIQQPKNWTDREGIVWAHQWRAWKGIVEYLEICSELTEPTLFFGAGMEYYMTRKENPALFKKSIGHDIFTDTVWNPKSKNKIMGTVSPQEIYENYKKAKAAIDFTGITGNKKYRGHNNRATIEPMFYGSVVICTPFLIEPYTYIPKECVLVVQGTDDKKIKTINSFLKDNVKRKKIGKTAYDWAIEKHDGQKTLQKWIDLVLIKKTTHQATHEYKNGIIAKKGKWWNE